MRAPRMVTLPGPPPRPLTIPVRESARARTARIVLDARGTLEVVVPRRYPERGIDALLRTHAGWIERQLARHERPGLGLIRPGSVWLEDGPIPVVLTGAARSAALLEAGRLLVGGPSDRATAAVDGWYRAEARARIGASIARQAPALGVDVPRLRIADQRTRWGSCSRSGTLSFSWRLLLAPVEVRDYVVAHELCHRRQLNHSPAFWALVERACPDWRTHAGWLRTHGHELQAYHPQLDAGER